jgi:hypothetical protein
MARTKKGIPSRCSGYFNSMHEASECVKKNCLPSKLICSGPCQVGPWNQSAILSSVITVIETYPVDSTASEAW